MTARALKEIDNIGGIDKYLLALDQTSVANSNYITKVRNQIGAALYKKDLLQPKEIKKLGFHKNPPLEVLTAADSGEIASDILM